MQEYLFHSGWVLPTLIALAGAALFFTANRRQDRTLQRVGLGILILAVAWGAVSYFVDTPIEKADRKTRQIISAIEKRDWVALRPLLGEHVALKVLDENTFSANGAGRDAILLATQTAAERYGLKSITITSLESKQTDALITTGLTVFTVQEATQDRPVGSSWLFDYENDGKDWILIRITLVQLGGESGGKMVNPFK